jgi:hypothetical protein
MEGSTILTVAPEGAIGVGRGIVLSIHRAAIEGARIGEIRSAFERASELAPRGLVALSVFRLSPEFPLDVNVGSNRAELASLLRVLDRIFIAHATIIEFGGIRAMTMRTLSRAVSLVARPRAAMRTFDGLTDAVTWLLPHAKRVDAATEPGAYVQLYRDVDRALDELDVRRGRAPRVSSAPS